MTNDPKMTAEELEQERADVLAAIDRLPPGEPIPDDLQSRIVAVARADLARPRTAFDEAFAEIVAEAVALSDEPLPPGLNYRVRGEIIEILSRGRVITTFARRSLLEREAEIERERARKAEHGPN